MPNGIKNKIILLGVCGGIAAYKSVELLRLITRQGAEARVILTRSALNFVGWMTFEALCGRPVCTDLFEKGSEASFKHIDWAQAADAVLIAPATANMIGKLANGIADDALSTLMLAVTAPVVLCPSMNTHMFESKPVQRNLELLRKDGYLVLEPGSGELACGTVGPGRLPEPEHILDRLIGCLSPKDLVNRKVLVTAGPTREAIDPVRFISNPSSGKMGFAVARAAEHRGAAVTLVTGPTPLPDPMNIEVLRVQSADEMAQAVFGQADDADIIIMTAAVSDYRPGRAAVHKIKKERDRLTLELEKTSDILKALGDRKSGQILVGFAAETEDLDRNAQKKLIEKNLDIIAGNLIGRPGSGFDSDRNIVTLYYRDGTHEKIPEMDKEAVAHILLNRIVEKILASESHVPVDVPRSSSR
jgi:phosphopantothenoylcysteine decarboxylase/phosphopantothenate--cysteine ligase